MAFELYLTAFSFFAALTPVERWRAASEPFANNFIAEHAFIIVILLALIILAASFITVTIRKREREHEVAGQLFNDYAKRRGLSPRERQILLNIVGNAQLRHPNAIFSTENAFDRGATQMIEQVLSEPQGPEECEELKMELSFLREKLGFQKKASFLASPSVKTADLSSRNIPVGRKVKITRRKSRDAADIEATVIENNEIELVIEGEVPVKVTFGELWRVRYHFGASIWEFDTTVISCQGEVMVLKHSENVRFINRRRFLRVPVNMPAFIARFPFSRTVAQEAADKKPKRVKQKDSGGASAPWMPPQFVPAVVTELAGPGLRIKVGLQVKIAERVLVIMQLPEQKKRGSRSEGARVEQAVNSVIQDVGEVRHTSRLDGGFSIAVELTGLSDSDLNELIRATNTASLEAGIRQQDALDLSTEEKPAEAVALQGA